MAERSTRHGAAARAQHAERRTSSTALDAQVARIPTEASAMAVRCARGERGVGDDPRRAPHACSSREAGGQLLWFDPAAALALGRRGSPRAVAAAPDLAARRRDPRRRCGVRTELAYERDAAAAPA